MSVSVNTPHENSQEGHALPGELCSAAALRAQRDVLGRCVVDCLDELDEHAAQLREARSQLARLHGSRGFRVLTALSRARGSLRGLLALPAALWSAFRPHEQAEVAPVACTDAAELVMRPARSGCARPLRVLAIVDEFTELCFGDDCELWLPGPDTGPEALAAAAVDFLFVESAWKGNGGRWQGRLESSSPAFLRLLDHVRRRGIPTVFWNKEDPVHFEHFLPLARHFDWVMTTARESVPAYKDALQSDQVRVMPFACQPALHNPMNMDDSRWAAIFAGSYYAKYPERNASLKTLVAICASLMPVEIYDRNYLSADPDLDFPPELAGFVAGGLPAAEVGNAYRQYRFAINVNTVTESRTMLARRVFELLASGTAVVSNTSPAVSRLFGELVIAGDDDEIRTRLASLLQPLAWKRHSLAGIRKVLEEHTWHHRLATIAALLGLEGISDEGAEIWCVCPVDGHEQIDRMVAMAAQQVRTGRLFLIAASSLQLDHVVVPDAVTLLSEEEAGHWSLPGTVMLAGWCAEDWYGCNYLHDLALGLAFGSADGVGKASFWNVDDQGQHSISNDGHDYRDASSISIRRLLLRHGSRWFSDLSQVASAVRADHVIDGDFGSLDVFNYCSNCTVPPPEAGDGASVMDTGISLREFVEH